MLSTQFSPCCEALYRVSLKYLNNVRSTMDYVKIKKKLRYPFHSTMFYQAAIRERKKTKHFGVQTSTIPPCTMKKLNVHVPNGLRNEQKSTAHSSIYPIMQKHGAQDLWQKRVEKEEKREQNARRKKKKREKGHPFENGSQNGIVTHGMPRLAIETGAWEHDRPIHGSHAIHSATVRPISGDPTRATEHTVQHSNPSSRPTLRKEACVVLPFPHKTLSNTSVHIYLNTHAVVCARAYITATTTLCNTRHTRVRTRGLRLRKRAKE